MNVLEEPVALTTFGLVQNLGPDTIYIGEADVVAGSGIAVVSDQAITLGASNSMIYMVSDGVSDVRILSRGLGMFSTG